jgi:hypothetical protein
MKAPSERFIAAYSEVQWEKIRATIRGGLDLDADRMTWPGPQGTTKVTFLPEGRRGTFTYTTSHDADPPPGFPLPEGEMMLRTALQRIAARIYRRPEPIKSLPKLREKITELHELLAEHGDEYADEAETLKRLSVRVRHKISVHNDARLNAYDAQRSRLLCDFINLWADLGGKRTGKAAEAFVVACVEPRLGSAATVGIGKWLERYHRGKIHFHCARELYTPMA